MSEAKGSAKQGLSSTGAMALLASATVHANTVGKQTLYTVPAGKHCIVTQVVMRNASVNLTPMQDVWSFGFDAFGSDWSGIPNSSVPTASTDVIVQPSASSVGSTDLPTPIKGGAAGDIFGTYFNDNSVVGTVVIDVFGYLY